MDVALYADRMCYVVEFQGNVLGRITNMIGKRYDFRGVALWLLCRWSAPLRRRGWRVFRGSWACGDNGRPFCFELGYLAMTGEQPQDAVSGKDLRKMAVQRGFTVRYMRFGELHK